MKPLSRKTVKFPNKTDCHPKSGYENWWESIAQKGKGKLKQEIENQILGDEYGYQRDNGNTEGKIESCKGD